jgi:ABC-type glycerol-3-phosphate transport system substrate-binding protein
VEEPVQRLIPYLVVLVLAVVTAGCGGDGETTTTTTETQTTTETTTAETTTMPEVEEPTTVRVRVVGGVPKGGIVRESVDKGDRVVLVVTSDVADHVHLHGYDIVRDVAAGGTARIRFRATLPGRFEVELEDRGVQIAELTVEP